MGKANKVKGELLDVNEMVYLIQTLKDIADNKYFSLMNSRQTFRRFGETFVEFFRMLSFTKTKHPLIANDNPTVGILVVTAEGSFLGQFNNKIIRLAIKEYENHPKSKFIAVGEKSYDKLVPFTPNLKLFSGMDIPNIYETAVLVKDYLVKQVMSGAVGKIVVCYAHAKDYETQRFKVSPLLPCSDLVVKQHQFVEEFENSIEESDPANVIGYLANLWITTRLYEMFINTMISAFAAQSQFLEESLDKMRKEQKRVKLKFRKARRSDIDKGLRETYASRMLVTQ